MITRKNIKRFVVGCASFVRSVQIKASLSFYPQGLVHIKDKLRDVEGPDMRETMQDQIRQWFIECRFVNFNFTKELSKVIKVQK